jgi:hypothetical protein
MSQIQKRGIAANAVDETKIQLNNNSALSALNFAGSAAVALLKLNASNLPEFSFSPVLPDPTAANQAASKGYTDTGLALKINTSLIGAPSGVAGLDASSKILTANLPASVLGSLKYKGTLDASTGAYPASPAQGDYYVISVAGTILGHAYSVGDWATYDGVQWDYIDNSVKVSSVNGFVGAIVLTTTNISEGTSLYYTQARFDAAFAAKSTTNLSEGTNLYFTNARVIAAPLTGYVSSSGVISATDTVLTAIQKLNGNVAAAASSFTRTKEIHTVTAAEVTSHSITLLHAPLAFSVRLYWQGVSQNESVDYSVSGTTVTFINGGDLYSGVLAADVIYIHYQY